jgi:hypothetical protein
MGRLLAAAALGAAVLALTGCSGLDAGEAAVSDEFRVSQAEVDAEVRLALESVGQPTGQPPAGLASATTQRLVQDALFAAKAQELGVQVTPGDVEQGVAALAAQNGGQPALEDLARQSGLAPESIPDFVRTSLYFQGIATKLDPSGDATSQRDAARAALAEYSAQIDVQVAPRYGTWDDTQLSIVPGSAVVTQPSAAAQP